MDSRKYYTREVMRSMRTSMSSRSTSKLLQDAGPKVINFFQQYQSKHNSHFVVLPRNQVKTAVRFIQKLNAEKYHDGDSSHRIICPENNIDNDGFFHKKAAVLIPIIDVKDKGPSILFTKRSGSVGTHAHQIAFPGGHWDENSDGSCLENTALRETREELSSSSSLNEPTYYDFTKDLQILGRLTPVPSMSGIMVTPFLGHFTKQFPNEVAVQKTFPGNHHEVHKVFTISMQQLLQTETSEPLTRWNGEHGPVFPVHKDIGGKIWGLSAIILQPVLHKILKPIFLSNETMDRQKIISSL